MNLNSWRNAGRAAIDVTGIDECAAHESTIMAGRYQYLAAHVVPSVCTSVGRFLNAGRGETCRAHIPPHQADRMSPVAMVGPRAS